MVATVWGHRLGMPPLGVLDVMDVSVGGDVVRGRALVRFLIVLAAVASMILAPVVTWPSSGQSVGEPPLRPGHEIGVALRVTEAAPR
jgi:hypothetical protein